MTAIFRWGKILLAATAIAVAIGVPRSAWAVPNFTPEGATLVSSAAVQTVIPISGGFRMYFAQSGFFVLSATSTDQSAWTVESGIRLSTGAISAIDGSSITSCGVISSTSAAFSLRMFYVGLSTGGSYNVLSATSSDGLTWTKDPGFRINVNGGRGFIDSPRPLRLSNGAIRLFYVADNTGGNNPANYRIFSASSVDEGITLSSEGSALASQAFQVSVTTLTDGRTRLYYSAPVGASVIPSQVLSAISTNGLVFSNETGVRLSTSASTAALSYPVVVRSTASFRWRMFSSYTPAGSTIPYTSSALTLFPTPAVMNPNRVLNSATSTQFTLTGEIFSLAPTVTFTIGNDTMTAFGLTRVDDETITGSINPLGRAVGAWDGVVTNSDSRSGTLSGALFVDFPPGLVTILDNLFRPLRGGTAKITVQLFNPGQLTLKLYTINGGLVGTLFDQWVPSGTYSTIWNGTTSRGSTVASGVYLLRARGPKLDSTQKIIVIK